MSTLLGRKKQMNSVIVCGNELLSTDRSNGSTKNKVMTFFRQKERAIVCGNEVGPIERIQEQ